MAIITLNEIIKMFSDFSDAHLQVNDFGYGPTSEIGTSRQMEFPYIWTTHRTSSVINTKNKTLIPEFTFTFIIVDQINIQSNYLDENGVNSDNQQEILSDTFQISQDLITYISTSLGKYGVMLTDDSITIEPLFDETQDKVTGWIMDVNLKIRHSNCTYPTDGVTPIAPVTNCPKVIIKNTNNTFQLSVNSGEIVILDDNDLIINNIQVDAIPAQTDIDLRIEDVNGNSINTNYNNGVITTPPLLGTTIYYNRPLNLQTTSYIKYDEAWYNINNWDTYTVPTNGLLQEIDRTNENRLIYDNSFGHKWRFTGINGGYYNNIDGLVYDVNGNQSDWDTEFKTAELIKGYIIDNLTGIGYIPQRLGTKTYDDIVTILDDYTANGYQGYSDWKIPSLPEFEVLKNQPYNYSLKLSDKTPFDYSQNQWTCTIYNETSIRLIIISPTTARYTRTARNTQNSGNLNLCRYHFT